MNSPIELANYAAINQLIEQLGSARRDLARYEAEMNDDLASTKAAFESVTADIKDLVVSRETAIRQWCVEHRKELTAGGSRKSYRFPAGEVAWRTRPPRVKIAKKAVTALLAWLRKRGLDQFIRTIEDLDKAAILKSPDVLKGAPGLSIASGGETFEITPFAAQLDGIKG